MKTFERATAADVEANADYRWANTRYDLASETERRASFAILEAMFRVDSLKAYLKEGYDIGLFQNADDKVFIANVQPRGTPVEGDATGRTAMPQLSLEQKAEIRTLLNLSMGNPDHAYRSVMLALGQEEEAISLASPADVRAVNDPSAKSRLDA